MDIGASSSATNDDGGASGDDGGHAEHAEHASHGHGSGGHAHVSQSSGNDGHGGEERHAADAEWARSFLSDVSGFSWGRDGKVPADESEW